MPSSSPLRCTSPADVYLLLKSSDFVTHDLSADSVFEGCVDGDGDSVPEGYQLELVLRKWFAMDPSREMRAFVRDGVLVGMCFFFTWCAYVSVYLLEYKASRSAIRITTSFWTSQRRSARSCRPSPRIGPSRSSQSGLDLHPVRSRAIDPSSFINVLIMLLVAPQTRSMYSSRATSRASTLWTLTHTPRGPMRYYSPTPSLPFFTPLPPHRLRPRHRYCA